MQIHEGGDIRRACPSCGEEVRFASRYSRGPRLGRCESCDESFTLFGGQVDATTGRRQEATS